MVQAVIVVLSVLAVWCSQTTALQRYACFFGLASQPFWFYMGATTGQWAIMVLCFVYGAAWFNGLRVHWYGREA